MRVLDVDHGQRWIHENREAIDQEPLNNRTISALLNSF